MERLDTLLKCKPCFERRIWAVEYIATQSHEVCAFIECGPNDPFPGYVTCAQA